MSLALFADIITMDKQNEMLKKCLSRKLCLDNLTYSEEHSNGLSFIVVPRRIAIGKVLI